MDEIRDEIRFRIEERLALSGFFKRNGFIPIEVTREASAAAYRWKAAAIKAGIAETETNEHDEIYVLQHALNV